MTNIGDIDPEIADLLGDDSSPVSVPGFTDLFEESAAPDQPSSDKSKESDEDFSRECFPSIERWEQDSDPAFFSKDYYPKVLTGEGEASQRLHTLLQKYLKTEDPQERGVYRQRLIPGWWELMKTLSGSYRGAIVEKRLAIRFGYILPTLISVEQRRMLSCVVASNDYGEPVHYVDEWLDHVVEGDVNPLASDEMTASRVTPQTRMKSQLEKAKGAREANLTALRNLVSTRDRLETELASQVRSITAHDMHPNISGVKRAYTPEQKQAFTRINELLRKLSKLDRDLLFNTQKYKDASAELGQLNSRIEQLGGLSQAEKSTLESDVDSLRQMAKLCVGRQGNHLPFLMKNFFFANIDMMGTRENVIRCMDQVEQVDPGVFKRTFRQKTNRIVPHTIIIPCYGDKGICWEPFERFNRSNSRGRIAIPMFPRNLKQSVIFALGDMRWNLAKEKAAHYWMEEGLTGYYYQWFSSRKLRGDVRLRFLEDYLLWITKEVEGVQKLDREVRGIFWRHMPFPQSVKDTLKNRGFVYDELYRKDTNRAASDGY